MKINAKMNDRKIPATAVLLLSFFVLAGFAQAKYSGGLGTISNPYRISTADDLLTLGADVNDYNLYFTLTADINLADAGSFGTAVIAPDVNNAIENFEASIDANDPNDANTVFSYNAFGGTFNGQGYKIINLTIDTNGTSNNYLGLFGILKNGCRIIDLGLENVRITSGNGAVYIGGLAGRSDAAVTACYSKSTIISGNNSGYVGGLVGDNNTGAITNCYTTGSITCQANSYNIGGLLGDSNTGTISGSFSTTDINSGEDSYNIGGLLGQLYSGTISKCYARGDISSGANSYDIGGLAGQLYTGTITKSNARGNVSGDDGASAMGGLVGDNRGTITYCYATGDVNGTDNVATLGGLAGYCSGTVSYSYAKGNVAGGDNSLYLGGLTGINSSTLSNCYATGAVSGGDNSLGMGGLTGEVSSGTITNCYSVGAVTGGDGTSNLGGLVGENSSGSFTYSYFLDSSGPDNHDTGVFPLTSKMMKQQKSFFGWDFFGESTNGTSEIWWINEGKGFPLLNWQMSVDKCTVTASAKDSNDSIALSGQMNPTRSTFSGASSFTVTISSDDIVNPIVTIFPISTSNTLTITYRNSKYHYRYRFSGADGSIKKSFTYNSDSRKFSFATSKVDLSGLGSPVTVAIDLGSTTSVAEVNERTVNGPSAPIPISLMTGVRNALRVDKCQVKQRSQPGSDMMSVKGGFAVENPDVNMITRTGENLIITLDSQPFTIPHASLKPGYEKFTFSKALVNEGGTATGEFNFNLCSFLLTIKDVNISPVSGLANFGVKFADFNEVEQAAISP